MLLCHAGRLILKPGVLTETELHEVDKLLRRVCRAFYKHVYAGKERRLRVWRPTDVDMLEVTENLRSCGPAWSYWQFPAERLLGTLSRLIRSRRLQCAALTIAVSSKYSAELVTSSAESHVADARENATGKPVRRESQDSEGTFTLSQEPKSDILPPRTALTAHTGDELQRMKAVLALEDATRILGNVVAKKFFRARLPNGQVAGTVSSSEEAGDRRREHLVRVNSHMQQAARRGRGEVQAPARVYGAVQCSRRP